MLGVAIFKSEQVFNLIRSVFHLLVKMKNIDISKETFAREITYRLTKLISINNTGKNKCDRKCHGHEYLLGSHVKFICI